MLNPKSFPKKEYKRLPPQQTLKSRSDLGGEETGDGEEEQLGNAEGEPSALL